MIKQKKYRQKNKKGFTLLEIIVALFVFSIAMVAVTAIFASFVSANRTTKNTQKALEDAEQAMNTMVKTIRTSSVVVPAVASTTPVTTIRILEYSQNPASPQCQIYQFTGSGGNARIQHALATDLAGTNSIATCQAAGVTFQPLTNVIDTPVTGGFIVTPSASQTVGKVTILMSVTAGTIQTPIQGTVSLRDYSVSE